MQASAMLTQLGYTPNDTLIEQFQQIQQNTAGYDKIEKHIMDLHDSLKPIGGYVALSNSENFFKIKVDAQNQAFKEEAFEKINHFTSKFKVALIKVEDKDTFYIMGFSKEI